VKPGQHAVKDVVVALIVGLVDDARFFEQVLLDASALDDAPVVEVNVDVLAEAARVVVTDGLGVSEGCETENMKIIGYITG
jgi:hypothetical protein